MTPLPIEPPTWTFRWRSTSQPGSSAVLVAVAGMSASAGIPAALGGPEDLIAKLSPPTGWCRTGGWLYHFVRGTYGREPGYDTLLADVRGTSNARQALLRGYFEPDRAEQERA